MSDGLEGLQICRRSELSVQIRVGGLTYAVEPRPTDDLGMTIFVCDIVG